jgi:hypothetical protein
MKLKSMVGEVLVEGLPHEVEWEGGERRVFVVRGPLLESEDGMRRVLALLSGASATPLEQAVAAVKAPAPRAAKAAPAPEAPAPPEAPTKAAPVAPAPEPPGLTNDQLRANLASTFGPPPSKPAASVHDEAAAPDPGNPALGISGDAVGGLAGLDMEKLKAQSKLREVIALIVDAGGGKTRADLVRNCLALKAEVPVLSRIADMQDRIDRTLEVLQITLP